MASMLESLAKGMEDYRFRAKLQMSGDAVKVARIRAKLSKTSRSEATVRAMGVGMATFVVPPVMIGHLVAQNYREQRRGEMQKQNIEAFANCLESHGLSPSGAKSIARQVIGNYASDSWITDADFKMWQALAAENPSLQGFTSGLAERHEWNRPPDPEPAPPAPPQAVWGSSMSDFRPGRRPGRTPALAWRGSRSRRTFGAGFGPMEPDCGS